MADAARHIRVASMAKAVVKSSQDTGTLALSVVNSKIRMTRVKKQQKDHVNMHQAQ